MRFGLYYGLITNIKAHYNESLKCCRDALALFSRLKTFVWYRLFRHIITVLNIFWVKMKMTIQNYHSH